MSESMIKIYLSLGGNQASSQALMQQAFFELEKLAHVHTFKVSPFYRTSPVDMKDPNPFINAVCLFETSLSLSSLWQETQRIERSLGKKPKPKWASRPIDIDILFYGTHVYQDDELEIPHARWKERLFVLAPLKDLTPTIHLQTQARLESYHLHELIHHLSQQTVELCNAS